MNYFEQYLYELRDIRATGTAVKEASYYGALVNLLNNIGQTIKPNVVCIMQLKDLGAGRPDGGFFSASQYRPQEEGEPIEAQLPERGVLEVKSTAEEIENIVQTEQIGKYLAKYGQLLITNYRDFLLVGQDKQGQPLPLELYRLAADEKEFWQKVQKPTIFAQEHEEQITEYLKRVLLRQTNITTPQNLAWFLASYAKDAKARVNKSDAPALHHIRHALEESLGIAFEGDKKDPEKGLRFFKSTLIQTLFYGLFSAWVLWHKQKSKDEQFNWRTAAWLLHVPMIRALFEKVATPSNLGRLDLVEVLDWTGEALNRVDREQFFTKFEAGQAVQYFYEPFLEAFDPDLRKELGVWYTPPEIVQYMVSRVDTVLRNELGLADGLADENVYILDPCCGTGAFLVEVVKQIQQTLQEKGGDALGGAELKEAVKNRIFGFELLTAPFVVAHLQLELLLESFGSPLQNEKERAGVFLTNALTGWEPPLVKEHYQLALNYPELQAEKEAADEIKRGKPILVVLGNPPYNAYAGVSQKEEAGLVEKYKEGLIEKWGIKKFNLDDLYVRFFGLAEQCIGHQPPGRGVVCYISNYSWLNSPSYVVLRQRLLNTFDQFWVENMHGDRRISEYAPDGRTSETVFAIQGFSPGIKQGVAISLWVKSGRSQATKQVHFRDDINQAKAAERRQYLLNSLNHPHFNEQYQTTAPELSNRFSFRPTDIKVQYLQWPKLTQFWALSPSYGLMEKRRGALIDTDKQALEKRMKAYFDPHLSWEAYQKLNYGLTRPQARFNPAEAREKALAKEPFKPEHLVRYSFKPFDTRWAYYTPVRPVWNEPRPTFWKQCWPGNQFLLTRFSTTKKEEGPPFYFTSFLADDHLLTPDAVAIPLQLLNGSRLQPKQQLNLLDAVGQKSKGEQPLANLSAEARAYLAHLGLPNPDHEKSTAQLLWLHCLAIGYSSAYLAENSDGIQQDFPRIPVPNQRELLLQSGALGQQLAWLLDTEAKVEGVTAGKIRPELRLFATISKIGGGQLDPAHELVVTAGWGHKGKGDVIMSGRGKFEERSYTPEETPENKLLWGKTTFDIYLNETAYWKNIPGRVWDYTIGGYQVLKKWLSYREEIILERPLTLAEVREFTDIVRRIAAILFLQPQLNSSYEAIKQNLYQWPDNI